MQLDLHRTTLSHALIHPHVNPHLQKWRYVVHRGQYDITIECEQNLRIASDQFKRKNHTANRKNTKPDLTHDTRPHLYVPLGNVENQDSGHGRENRRNYKTTGFGYDEDEFDVSR
jgi:hypothetical protein